jgi:hypothetical protein
VIYLRYELLTDGILLIFDRLLARLFSVLGFLSVITSEKYREVLFNKGVFIFNMVTTSKSSFTLPVFSHYCTPCQGLR